MAIDQSDDFDIVNFSEEYSMLQIKGYPKGAATRGETSFRAADNLTTFCAARPGTVPLRRSAHDRKPVIVLPDQEIRLGELRRLVRLGSEAVYRVCELDGDAVVLEVVRAPGLLAGQRFRYTTDAVRGMTVVRPDDPGLIQRSTK